MGPPHDQRRTHHPNRSLTHDQPTSRPSQTPQRQQKPQQSPPPTESRLNAHHPPRHKTRPTRRREHPANDQDRPRNSHHTHRQLSPERRNRRRRRTQTPRHPSHQQRRHRRHPRHHTPCHPMTHPYSPLPHKLACGAYATRATSAAPKGRLRRPHGTTNESQTPQTNPPLHGTHMADTRCRSIHHLGQKPPLDRLHVMVLRHLRRPISTRSRNPGRARMMKACTICGTPSTTTRCQQHPPTSYGRPHRRASATTMANATVCWICGQPPHTNDPLTADHITPLARQGQHRPDNYAAAHRSCNSSRGAPLRGGGQ